VSNLNNFLEIKIMARIDDREYILSIIQDMRVKIRDIDNYYEKRVWSERLKLFEKGLKEEYGTS
jgi:hypothetical protein